MSSPTPDSADNTAAAGIHLPPTNYDGSQGAVPLNEHDPFVSAEKNLPELTWPALVMGVILGIIFGASSLYLALKVGMTVSASIPVAVLSITLFRVLSKAFGLRKATILENNIVQTTGSAGESIAFGVGVTMPALLLLGFEMDVVRVLTVSLLGGLLGILMMIPLRRAFIVKQHGQLTYPEGTACADVLIAGEQGGATAVTVFSGFGMGLVFKFLAKAMHFWKEEVEQPLYTASGKGLKGGVLGAELSPELLGVGYIIGPRIASVMVAGGVLAYLVLTPLIVLIGDTLAVPVAPAVSMIDPTTSKDMGLIRNMEVSDIRTHYILYIGAGAVATGGIISMFQALPLIVTSFLGGLRDLRGRVANPEARKRTDRDLPLSVVLFGSLGMVLALAAAPKLGLGFTPFGFLGGGLIVVFGFLFVTVSSRLTGQIGSSSNPISGMTVATLLLTCLVFLMLGKTDNAATLTALTIAAVVCIASSNGGTTSQDLKTGYLVGGTPSSQQIAILVGALTSALVIGGTLLLLNDAGTVYSKKNLPAVKVDVTALTDRQQAAGQYAADPLYYHVLHVKAGENSAIPPGKYLVTDEGTIAYFVDPAINGRLREQDDGTPIPNKFEAPKTRLMALIIDGVLQQKLPWTLVVIGVLIAVTLELVGVPSLPFAVGVYLPLSASVPVFIGGMTRWLVDRLSTRKEADADFSPGVLLSSGYIAGGAIAGVLVAFFVFLPRAFNTALAVGDRLPASFRESNWPALVVFALLLVVLFLVGLEKLLKSPPPSSPCPES